MSARRVQKFRADYAEFRAQFEKHKTEVSVLCVPSPRASLNKCACACPFQQEAAARSELLAASSSSTTPLSAGMARQRFMNQQASENNVSESPFRNPSAVPMSDLREQHALREHSFIHNTEARLDDFIAQGRAVLDDLVEQRTVLKGTQRRLLDAANTLGLSRDVIGWIERRRCVAPVTVSVLAHVSDCVQYTGYVYLLRWSNLYFCLFLLYMEVSWVRLLCSGGSRLDIPL